MSVALFEFNNIRLITVTINGKTWTRAKEICQSLNYVRETGHVIRDHCSSESIRHKYQLIGLADSARLVKWPVDSQKYDLYINEEGLYELLFSSQQSKAKSFRKYCCNTMFPKIRQQLHQQDIDEKDMQLALLNDDLTDREQEIVILEHNIDEKDMKLTTLLNDLTHGNGRIDDLIINRHVPRSGDIDNILIFIEKNMPFEEHEYYSIRCQKKKQGAQISKVVNRYPQMVVRGTYEDANAIHHWARFKRDFLNKNYHRRNHFSLTDEQKEEFEDVFNIIM